MDEFVAPTEEVLESTFGSRRRAIAVVDRDTERRQSQPIDAEIAAMAASRRANIRRQTRVAMRDNQTQPPASSEKVTSRPSAELKTRQETSQSQLAGDLVSHDDEDPFGDIPGIAGSLVPTPRGSANSVSSTAERIPAAPASPPMASPAPPPAAPTLKRHAQIIFQNQARQPNSSSGSEPTASNMGTPKSSELPSSSVFPSSEPPSSSPLPSASVESAASSTSRRRKGLLQNLKLGNPFKKRKPTLESQFSQPLSSADPAAATPALSVAGRASAFSSATHSSVSANADKYPAPPLHRVSSATQKKFGYAPTHQPPVKARPTAKDPPAPPASSAPKSSDTGQLNKPLQAVLADEELVKINQELIDDRVTLIDKYETQINLLKAAATAGISPETLEIERKAFEVKIADLLDQLNSADLQINELRAQNQALHLQVTAASKKAVATPTSADLDKLVIARYGERIAIKDVEIEALKKASELNRHDHSSAECPECAEFFSTAQLEAKKATAGLERALQEAQNKNAAESEAAEAQAAKLRSVINEQRAQIDRMTGEIDRLLKSPPVLQGDAHSTRPIPSPMENNPSGEQPEVAEPRRPAPLPQIGLKQPQAQPKVKADSPRPVPLPTPSALAEEAFDTPGAPQSPPREDQAVQVGASDLQPIAKRAVPPPEPSQHEAVVTCLELGEEEAWRVLEPEQNKYFGKYEVYSGGPPERHNTQWNPMWGSRPYHYNEHMQYIDGCMQPSELWQYRWVDGRYKLECRKA